MSKLTDKIIAEAIFRPGKSEKSEVETFMKVYKVIKKLEEKEKAAKPKEDKKGKGWWEEASVLQKLTILTALVPVVFTIEFLLPVLIIAKILGIR